MSIQLDRPAGPPGSQAEGPRRLAWPAALLVVNLALITILLAYPQHGSPFGPYRIDLDVYRLGGRTWLHDGALYNAPLRTRSGMRLPFSYPPFAAVVLSPLSLVPMMAASVVLTLATIGLIALVLALFLRSVAGPSAGSWRILGILLPVALLLEPVRNTIGYGQVNVALMALVTLDCLVGRPPWPRGVLVGVAAAVKLTPAAFVLYFLARRDLKAAGMAALSFLACTGSGFLLDRGDSLRYWTSLVFQTGRPGTIGFASNQSIMAVLARDRLATASPGGVAVWLSLSAVVVALAWRGMRGPVAQAVPALALSLNAFAALLVSPVSWSHHWVWGEAAVLVLVVVGWSRRDKGALALAAAGLVIFAVAPQWLLPHAVNRELHWSGWQQLVGNSYLLFAVTTLVAYARCLELFQSLPWSPARRERLSADLTADCDG